MMQGIKLINLSDMLDELGEETVKGILSKFSCPLNPDVEHFLRYTAVEFQKQGISATHLVMMQHKKSLFLSAILLSRIRVLLSISTNSARLLVAALNGLQIMIYILMYGVCLPR